VPEQQSIRRRNIAAARWVKSLCGVDFACPTRRCRAFNDARSLLTFPEHLECSRKLSIGGRSGATSLE
jgi:hypothetical protein